MTFSGYKYLVPAMLGSSIRYLNVALFPGLQSANAVEGLVKILSRIMSGGRLKAWLIEVWHFQSLPKNATIATPPYVLGSLVSSTDPTLLRGETVW